MFDVLIFFFIIISKYMSFKYHKIISKFIPNEIKIGLSLC